MTCQCVTSIDYENTVSILVGRKALPTLLGLANVNISQNASSDQGRPQSQPQPFFKPPEHQGQGVDSSTDTLEKNEPDRGGVVSKGLLSLYA